MGATQDFIRWFAQIGRKDVAAVGGKNSSLGEMITALEAEGIRVPEGFATTSSAYRRFLLQNQLGGKIADQIRRYRENKDELAAAGKAIRTMIRERNWPEEIAEEIRQAYRELGRRLDIRQPAVAVRSSATAEDMPEASFAGQLESFLNISGEADLLDACRSCYASLFTDRAISYRENKGFDHLAVTLSVGVQQMVRADTASSGVMFSLDPETGFPGVVVIDGAWGLGENVVQGTVNPDSFIVFKPLLDQKNFRPILQKRLGSKERKMVYAGERDRPTRNIETSAEERQSFVLSDEEILQLARWAVVIERHYGRPMDMEWAKDGESGGLYIVQARPETVQSIKGNTLKSYSLKRKGEVLLTGLAVGERVAAGKVQVIRTAADIDRFREGNILVTGSTDPDWVPIMKKAAGIITDQGGRTSHAAIVSRELGIAAVVGTGQGTSVLTDDQEVTLSCVEGDEGRIYRGILEYEEEEIDLDQLPRVETPIMLNIASPGAALRWWRLPVQGIGLARMEFIINNSIQIHPLALVDYDRLEDEKAKQRIDALTLGYEDRKEFFVDRLSQGIALIAASRWPDPVIVRMSDFKTNEYADLIGGSQFEFREENPMLGFRGASRYYSERYRRGFALECAAIRRVREEIGLSNVVVMVPFCRTPDEADRVLTVLAEHGLVRGEKDLEVFMMVEIPANIELAEQFAERFDGFSIGSNDLTQLVLGVDRDSSLLGELFDERNPAVKSMISRVIRSARKTGTKIGICGQAPSDYPDFAAFLVEEGIDSISLNPDSVVGVIRRLGDRQKRMTATPGNIAGKINIQ